MQIKKIRNLHLYLGCFFAPLIIFYALTGVMQTLGLHGYYKNGATPPEWLRSLAEVHMSGGTAKKKMAANSAYIYFAVAMASALALNVFLGLMLAFKLTPLRKGRLISIIILGAILPCLLYLI